MAILDHTGRRINPAKGRIKVGDLGELTADKEWRKYLYNTRDGAKKEKERRQRYEAQRKREAEQDADRLKYKDAL